MKWPTSTEFGTGVYPRLRNKLCARSLAWGAVRQLLRPLNWRFLLSRANLVSAALKNEWNVQATLSQLPVTPEWSINGTTAENGKRFRFKRDSIGDYSLGYADPKVFPLSSALAVSAAFPGGIGPLSLDATRFEWMKRDWGAPPNQATRIAPMFQKLRLYDGGVYDNLGLEPLFDTGKGEPKHKYEFIVVSDAGSPLEMGLSAGVLSPWRLKRLADIMSDQSRALRVRSFSNYLQRGTDRGAYAYIATPLIDRKISAEADFVCRFPTTLSRLKLSAFDMIANHGYNVAKKVHETFGLFPPISSSIV